MSFLNTVREVDNYEGKYKQIQPLGHSELWAAPHAHYCAYQSDRVLGGTAPHYSKIRHPHAARNPLLRRHFTQPSRRPKIKVTLKKLAITVGSKRND